MQYVKASAVDIIQPRQLEPLYRVPHEYAVLVPIHVRKLSVFPNLPSEDVRKTKAQMIVVQDMIILFGLHNDSRRLPRTIPMRPELDDEIPKAEWFVELVI